MFILPYLALLYSTLLYYTATSHPIPSHGIPHQASKQAFAIQNVTFFVIVHYTALHSTTLRVWSFVLPFSHKKHYHPQHRMASQPVDIHAAVFAVHHSPFTIVHACVFIFSLLILSWFGERDAGMTFPTRTIMTTPLSASHARSHSRWVLPQLDGELARFFK